MVLGITPSTKFVYSLKMDGVSHPFLLNAPARAFICGGTPDCQAHEGLEVTVHR